jgi:hypothetical protein
MFERAAADVQRAGGDESVRIEEADILAMPYPDHSFDVVDDLADAAHGQGRPYLGYIVVTATKPR